jgi:hypothetical protein
VRLVRVGMVVCGILGCKDAPSNAPAPRAAPTPPPTAPVHAPADVASPPSAPPTRPAAGEPLTLAEAAAVLPAIDGAAILPLKHTSDQLQVHGTWCIEGTSAQDVARKVGEWMTAAGFTGVVARGDARKAGVQGDRDAFRMSMIVSASTAASCSAPTHYFSSATVYKP